MIRNILFDMNVFLERLFKDSFISSRTGLDKEDSELLTRELDWAQMEMYRDSITEEEVVSSICSRLPERLHEAVRHDVKVLYHEVLNECGEYLIHNLRENGYHIYLLTNMGKRLSKELSEFQVSKYFEDTLISSDVHLVKPQPEIYALALEKFGILPEESVLIDKTPQNAVGACHAGVKAIVYHNSMEELCKRLTELGVCVDTVLCAMEELNEKLVDIAADYLNGPNLSYSLFFEEVAAPDEEYIKDICKDPDNLVLSTLQNALCIYYPDIEEKIKDTIITTLNNLCAEFYDSVPHQFYLVRIRGEREHWYAFDCDWGD